VALSVNGLADSRAEAFTGRGGTDHLGSNTHSGLTGVLSCAAVAVVTAASRDGSEAADTGAAVANTSGMTLGRRGALSGGSDASSVLALSRGGTQIREGTSKAVNGIGILASPIGRVAFARGVTCSRGGASLEGSVDTDTTTAFG